MLGTMTSLGARRDSASPLPLALALTPREAHSHHRPHAHLHPAHPLATHPFSYTDPIRRLALARLPPPRRPASNNKPFTSFCIKDILGGEVEKEESSRLSETPSATSAKTFSGGSNSKPKSNTKTSGCVKPSGGGKTPVSHHSIVGINGRVGTNGAHRPRSSVTSPPSTLSVPNPTSPKVPIPAVSLNGARIVRPWAPSPNSPDTEISSDDGVDSYHDHIHDNDDDDDEEEEISVDDDEPMPKPLRKGGNNKSGVSPLDALMAMTSKTFEGLEAPDAADARRRDQAALFGKHAPPKKRRKSRTAFTNQQIYELEKRFLYQKYLTPADRDEIAHSLGLTNAQVITWFQNRRAKLKRDLEELKNDVTASRKHPLHKSLMGTVAEMQLRQVHEEVLQKAVAAAAAGVEPVANSTRRDDRRFGDSITPPSSPCSVSAPVTSPALTSSSPFPASGGLSPAGSYNSNSSDGNLSPGSVCNLSASNNNNTHTTTSITITNNNNSDVSADNNTDSQPSEDNVHEGLKDKECVSERVSPVGSPGGEPRVSPAGSPKPADGCEREESDQQQEGNQEEDMEVDVSEEQEEGPSASSEQKT